MAVNTWDGATDTDWNTAGNWNTTGVTDRVPTADDDVIIANVSNDPVIGSGLNPTINSLKIENGGNLNGNGNTITIDDKDGSSYSFRAISGSTISGTLNIKVTGNGGYISEQATGSINNLEVDLGSSSDVHYLDIDLSIGGNLTITEGIFNTNGSSNRALTVTGDVEIENGGTLTCNASVVSLGSLTINSGGTYSATSGTTTITSESSLGYAANVDGTFTHNNGTLTITTPAHTYMSPITPYNLIINHASANVRYTGAPDSTMTIANDLTITAGVFDPDDGNENLTVTGDVSIANGGTLGASDVTSAMTFGSLTIESGGTYTATSGTTTITSFINNKSIVNNSGTFTHNSGTVVIDVTNSNKTMVDARATYYNLTINSDGSNKEVELNNQAATIEGNLTVQEGKLFTYATSGRHLTVTGDVSIEDGGEIEMNDVAGKNATFGSLTINSGGTYNATSGTTTLTGKNSSNYMLQNSGTFTHNKGTVKFEADTSSGTWYATNASSVEANSIQFYNLETVRTGSAGSYRFFVGGNSFYLVVLNNLTIGVNTNIHSSNGTSILRHYGPLFNIEGQASFDNVTDVQCGLITIGSAGVLEIDNGDQTISCTGIRNLRGSAGIQA